MQTLTRRTRRVAVAVAGLAAACALTVPAAAAHAATSYTPSSSEWWMSKWDVPQQVWPVSEGSGVTVAVLDSGVQASESDLQGVVKPGADMLGEPGNGEIDYEKPDGHGTAVAAVLAGQGVGGGPVGIAPQAKILPVHVTTPNEGMAPVANGIKYAVDHGASVINMSFGETVSTPTSCDPALQQAVDYALAHNVVLVAGSGDTNLLGPGPEEPATCAGVLAVGGVEQNGSLWQNSTQGPQVSVAAPGDHMVYLGADGRFTTTGAGTSFSSPLVAGAAALIRSKYPSMPWYQVDQRLIGTAIPVGSVPNDGTGYGIIDIAKAVDVSRYPVKASAPNPPYTRYEAYLKSTGQSGGSGQSGGAAAPSASPKASKGSSLGIVVAVVAVVILLAVVALVIVLATRNRKRRGPRNPGGGGYPPNPYGPPAGQYPPPGYPQGQYPPGPYQQQYPPAPQPPGQYPPPQQ